MIIPPDATAPSEEQAIEDLMSGTTSSLIISHPGISQYITGGLSSCGLACFNCARIILGREREGLRGLALLNEIVKLQTTQDILNICSSWTRSTHLDVEDIYHTPMFDRPLRMLRTDAGQPSRDTFKKMLKQLREFAHTRQMSICALVTRPPEIICCFYIFGNPKDIFVVFDSHPRPDIHPSGAGFIFKTSMNEMSEYLAHLLPFDNKLLEGDMQWEAQLLGNLTAHTLMAREQVNVSMIDEIKRASIEILTLKADLAKAKTDMNSLAEENRRLQNNVGQSKRPELPGPPAWTPRRTWGPFPTLQPKTLDLSSSAGPSMQGPVKQREPRSPLRSGKKASKKGARKALKDHSDDFSAQDLGMGDDDLAFALAQQRIYDEESARLKAERSLLGRSGLGTFECSVCFEKFSEEFVAKVSRCDHQFCRDCIRRYVETELEERKYPIFCPLCIVDEKGKERSIIDNALIQQVGLSEEQFTKFTELELATFSIMIHCRSCKQSFFVDKTELTRTRIITCPLPGCNNVWCKACYQKVTGPASQHSCDGSSELKHLMKQKGWKHCPGCQTPAEKISGCNHITCTAPACHTHYCYVCGKLIINSTNKTAIQAAIGLHFISCKLFEDIAE